jgi:hypothetical protein
LLSLAFVILDALSPFSRSALETVVVWAPSCALGVLALHVSQKRAARIVCAALLGTVWIVQAAAIRTYNAPVDYQIADAAKFSWHDIRPVIVRALPAVVAAGAICGAGWYFAARYGARALSRWQLVLAGCIAAAGLANARRATPEYRALHAVTLAVAPSTPALSVGAPHVPTLEIGKPMRVLVVLGESVRASDYCGDADAPCEVAPRVHALLPKRVVLKEIRSLASYTAVSTAALMTGRAQLGTRDALGAMPTLFDVGMGLTTSGQPLGVVYYASQQASVFDRKPKVDAFVPLEEVLGRSVRDDEDVLDMNADRMVVDRYVRDLKPTWHLSILHLSGTHAPYYIDPARAHFTPYSRSVSWSSLEPLHRAYLSAIRIQDEEVARAMQAFMSGGAPWAILFTSDHGEAFGEHSAVHHGQNLYDEQTHVPGFVAWSEGALSGDQERTLRMRAQGPVTHLDVVPTMLDLLGVLNAPSLAPLVAALEGESLLRARVKVPRALPLTNCTEYFPCPLSTWGVLGETHTLIAQPWDRGFRCMKIHGDEDPGDPECARLQAESARVFPTTPNGKANR